jgi:hypothetical protein
VLCRHPRSRAAGQAQKYASPMFSREFRAGVQPVKKVSLGGGGEGG